MDARCEWCGRKAEDWPWYEVEVRSGLGDPFEKREKRFRACSDVCRGAAVSYYQVYDRHRKSWFAVLSGIVMAAFVAAIPGGATVFRWAMPVSLFFCGAILAVFPYANRFSRDRGGSLKTPLKHSKLDGRLGGLALMALSAFFFWRNLQNPAVFF